MNAWLRQLISTLSWISRQGGFFIFLMERDYVLGNTIKLPAPGMLWGDPGACVTLVGVTVKTNSLPDFVLIA